MQNCLTRWVSVLVVLWALLWCLPAYGQETVSVTQDQLELRSDPADNDENILGTLRANTPVTFTGKVSGNWYQVTAPNGQTGWVHQSGVSRPKSLVKPTPTPKPVVTPKVEKTPAQPTSRAVSKPAEKQEKQPEKAPASQTARDELDTLNKQYKAQLDEKDRRIAEISKELDAVKIKLTDAGKTATDLEQLRKSDESKLAEIQTQIALLNDTIQQKENALAAQKAEFAAVQEELHKQTTSQQTASLQRTLLFVSLPLNLLGLILLGYFGIRHIANKQEKALETLPHAHETELAYPDAVAAEKPVKRPSSGSVKIQIGKEMTDSQLKDLDVIMTSSSPEAAAAPTEDSIAPAQEDEVEIEETVIDLGDALDDESSEHLAMDVSEPGVIITDETIIVDEPIEVVREDVEEISEHHIEPSAPAFAPVPAETIEEPPALEEMEEKVVEVPAPAASVIEEFEEVDVQELEDDVELEFDDEDIEETPVGADAETISLDDNDMDALLADTPSVVQTADMNELLEPGELEEPTFDEIEIAGERFETLPERGTQIIEMDSEEEPYGETPVEGEIEDDIMLESEPGIIEDVEEEPEEMTARTIVQVPRVETAEEAIEFEAEEPSEPSFANLRTHDEIDELLDMIESPLQSERASKQDADSRGFAEPSPYLIEPEHESEDLETTGTIDEENSSELKYTIELVRVGKNRDHVLHILSKVQGLPKTPEELLVSTPCTIARGANKQDAQNFQMLMKKFGAEVRLTQHSG
ncbi:hypothetical protein U14_02847 [Candidatus Moduliflexus flocculans]|uniref:SH3b domain-containing protein n=1 Tax=Candidatus Moduliflexus flocculans TaxID=1499966 RepID=A0A081BMI6_9BACT|nr:hypothetical protein U14_02847 [Candidatus Moduliflexus flocculans]